MKITILFSECEHEGDLDHYLQDIISSGGKILASGLDEEETGFAQVEITEKETFLTKFQKTDSYGFSNL